MQDKFKSSKTRRVNVTLPEGIYKELEIKAKLQGRSPASLSSFYIEHQLALEKYQQSFVPKDVLIVLLKKLKGEALTNNELDVVASFFDLPVETIN